MHQIVPWKCHDCGREFELTGGGLCKKCGKPTCSICFGVGMLRLLVKLKLPESRVCRSCVTIQQEKSS